VPTTIDPGTDHSKRHALTLSDPNCGIGINQGGLTTSFIFEQKVGLGDQWKFYLSARLRRSDSNGFAGSEKVRVNAVFFPGLSKEQPLVAEVQGLSCIDDESL
jgi:hypothetical protein